jgi:rare lipoprotein A
MEMTCASPSLPFGTRVLVVNKRNGRRVIVTVSDRGPNRKLVAKGRLLDLSKGAFAKIAPLSDGVIPISMEVL